MSMSKHSKQHMMAGRGRATKRKSEDFIYEVDDKDLSTDEDESVKTPSCKISKLDNASVETSKTKHNLSTDNEKTEMDSSVDSVPMKTKKKNKLQCNEGKNSLITEKSEMNSLENSNNTDVIEIDDNSTDQNNSVIIVEDPVSILVVSDDEVEEEGEIVEDLEIVDEVSATPLKKSSQTPQKNLADTPQKECPDTPQKGCPETPQSKSPVNNPLEKETPEKMTSYDNEEFQVVEEIGPSPKPKEKENIMNITFSSQKYMNEYGHLLAKFLKSFPEIETITDKLCIKVNEKEIFQDIKTPKKKNKKKKPKKDLFVVDTNPSSQDDSNYSSLVRYTSKFTIEEEAESANVSTKTRPAQTCFNCGGGHALRDCATPRNHQRINQARQQFLDRNKTVRYHGEQNQKLADFKPGVISESLRNALGLNKNELPRHIYRMRYLGYPPGWLEEAKVLPSDLTMFNIDGEKVEHKKNRTSIDPEKIVEYPGFNIPPKKGCFDDFRRHNVKPYNKSMHKSSMIKYYEDLYRKEPDSSSDMDISEPKETEKKSIEQKVRDRASTSVNSPSLVDLEEKKKELIDQLNSSQQQAKSSTNDGEENSSQDGEENSSQGGEENSSQGGEENSSQGGEESSQENFETKVVKEDLNITAVKNTSLGTPILKSSSPYSRLPNPDNFSVGVSPVIDFENLPNSTGKYEELSKVLSKVRMTMKTKF